MVCGLLIVYLRNCCWTSGSPGWERLWAQQMGSELRKGFLPFFFSCTMQCAGSYSPDQGSNPCPLQWQHGLLNHYNAREGPEEAFWHHKKAEPISGDSSFLTVLIHTFVLCLGPLWVKWNQALSEYFRPDFSLSDLDDFEFPTSVIIKDWTNERCWSCTHWIPLAQLCAFRESFQHPFYESERGKGSGMEMGRQTPAGVESKPDMWWKWKSE